MNRRKILLLAATAVLVAALYMIWGVNFSTSRFALYSLEIRLPRLLSMVVVAFAIGTASIVFQSIINNTLVTPCLLGPHPRPGAWACAPVAAFHLLASPTSYSSKTFLMTRGPS